MIGFVTANLQWKALALLMAVALWYYVVGEPELVTSHSVPVYFKDLPRDMEIGSEVPDRVRLEVRGPKGKLTPANLADTAVVLDLASVQAPGERTFSVNDANISLPIGVALIRTIPSQLRLEFEKLLSKSVPVEIGAGQPPPEGYVVVSQSVKPTSLRVLGPEAHVQQVNAALTDPVDLGALVGAQEFRVHAYVPDPQVRFEGSPTVAVRIVVAKKSGQ